MLGAINSLHSARRAQNEADVELNPKAKSSYGF
jgi:hypothetical protein